MIEIDVSKGIQVGGFHYDIDTSNDAMRRCRSENRIGECSHQEGVIRIDPTFSDVTTSSVFIHEAIEAVKNVYCVKVEHDDIERLEAGLHQVMESLGVRFVVKK